MGSNAVFNILFNVSTSSLREILVPHATLIISPETSCAGTSEASTFPATTFET